MRRALKLIASDTYSQAINFGSKLLLIPLFISSWGAESYGEWLIVSALASVITIFDFGTQIYFTNKITELWYKKNILYIDYRDLGATLVVVLPISATILYFPYSIYLLKSFEFNNIASEQSNLSVLLLFILKNCISIPSGYLIAILRGTGEQLKGIWLSNLYETLVFIVYIIALSSGAMQIMCASFELILSLAFVGILIKVLSDDRMPNINISLMRNAIFKTSLVPSLNFFLYQLTNLFSNQILVAIIGIAYSSTMVTIYSTYKAVGNVINRILGVVSHAYWPELTRMYATNNLGKCRDFYLVVLLGITTSALAFQLTILNYGNDINNIIVKDAFVYDSQLMLLLVLISSVGAIVTWPTNLLMAVTVHKFAIFFNVLGAFFGTLIAYLCSSHVDIYVFVFLYSIFYLGFAFFGVAYKIKDVVRGVAMPTVFAIFANIIFYLTVAW